MSIVRVTYTILDDKGAQGTVRFYTDSEHINDVDTPTSEFVKSAGRALDVITLGQIIRCTLNYNIPLTGEEFGHEFKTMPVPDSDIEEGGQFLWVCEGNRIFKQTVPAFDHSLFGSEKTMNPYDLPSWWVGHPSETWAQYMTAPIELTADWSNATTDERGADIQTAAELRKVFRPR